MSHFQSAVIVLLVVVVSKNSEIYFLALFSLLNQDVLSRTEIGIRMSSDFLIPVLRLFLYKPLKLCLLTH